VTSAGGQIFAFSGILRAESDTRTNADLVDYAIAMTGNRSSPRVCYLPTGVGDSPAAVKAKTTEFRERRPDVDFSVLTLFPQPNVANLRRHLLEQDLILVEGGSVANLLAVWRVHGLDEILRECWHAGVALAGPSAGSICWHTGGPTDSFGDDLAPFCDGLGLVPFSNGVHDDFTDQPRRKVYRELVAAGSLGAGYATEDGVGLHYVGTSLSRVVTIRPAASAWWVESDGRGGYREERIPTDLI
jgi:peptidase E